MKKNIYLSLSGFLLFISGFILSYCDVVPYTGADKDLDMGEYNITANKITVGTAIDPAMVVDPTFTNVNTPSITLGATASDATAVIGTFAQVGTLGTNGFQGNTTFGGTVSVTGNLSGPTITNLTPAQVNTSASTYTIPSTGYNYCINFTGTGCTATLPITGLSNNRTYFFTNFGSGPAILNTYFSGNDIWKSGTTTNADTIPPGGIRLYRNGNSKFIKFL